jgi:hypothetical protein
MRHVKGVLFLDYVRMLRSHRGTDWTRHLPREDHAFLSERIDPRGWYPMTAFERFGELILRVVARGELQAVRAWGRLQVDILRGVTPALVEDGDPLETLNRFRVLRGTFFDFDALSVPMAHDGEATIVIHYHMGPIAEEAASVQTMGFFERLLDAAGAREVKADFERRSWRGDGQTVLRLAWHA